MKTLFLSTILKEKFLLLFFLCFIAFSSFGQSLIEEKVQIVKFSKADYIEKGLISIIYNGKKFQNINGEWISEKNSKANDIPLFNKAIDENGRTYIMKYEAGIPSIHSFVEDNNEKIFFLVEPLDIQRKKYLNGVNSSK